MALARIAADLRTLRYQPLAGIAAAPFGDDLWVWHFNLRGACGEHDGLLVHGVLKLGARYPSAPPEIRLCTGVPNPNVWRAADGAGFEVCMDMLDAGSSAPYSGWSSSYCISSMLLQLQSVLFDERAAVFDQIPLATALHDASGYACPCGHHPGCVKPCFPTGTGLQKAGAHKVVSRPFLGSLLRPSDLVRTKGKVMPASSSAASSSSEVPRSSVQDGTGTRQQQEQEGGCGSTKERQSEDQWCQVQSRRTEKKQQKQQEQQEQLKQLKQQVGVLSSANQGPCSRDWGIRVSGSAELTEAKQRNARRAQKRASKRTQQGSASLVGEEKTLESEVADEVASTAASSMECEKVCSEVAPVARPQGTALGRVPLRLLIQIMSALTPEDAARVAGCGRFFASLGDDGILWKHLFSQRYPSSSLTAESMQDWKHCFLLEVNNIEADLVCFHTKTSFREAVLGIPLDFSVNPRTRQIDYISTTLDFLSAGAFSSGLRRSQWNESFTEWLPLYLSQEHFERARPFFEKALVRLSPHWRSSRFHPHMLLEVVPKLMNTMIVLLCDKGIEASDRALDGYFLLWRLLRGGVAAYRLQREVDSRLRSFLDTNNRTKTKVPSMGDFLPLIAVQNSPLSAWQALAQPVLEETFDRNVLWAARDYPEFANPLKNVLNQGADMERLEATLASTKVSKRLLMFHVRFLELVARQSADLFYGLPSQHTRRDFKQSVKSILDVERWPEFFQACGRPCPGPAKLTDILKQATKNSLRKKYHTGSTDFSRIQRSGVSHILRKGESYKVGASVKSVHLELGSDSSMILCGACLVYEDLTCGAVVSYDSRTAYKGAVRHSGDTSVNGKSRHVIDVDLSKLPSSVTRIFFTLCSCGCADLSGFKSPTIAMTELDGGALCQYSIEKAGRAPTVVMASISRKAGSWHVDALGVHSAVGCCGNYSQVKRDIARIRLG